MAHVMFPISLLASVILCASSNEKVTISTTPNYEDGPMTWHQTVTISCSWTPAERNPQMGDVLTDEDLSVWSDAMYADLVDSEDPNSRAVLIADAQQGVTSLVIKDITKADARNFRCNVPRLGSSIQIKLEILEPPTVGVTNLVATPEFTTVTLTFDAVEGATEYTVGIQAKDEATWREAKISGTEHTFEALGVATTHVARASASNAAGIREGIEPAETSFKTKDNRPPQPVDDLVVSSGKYNETSITITWSLQTNKVANHIITGITATVGLLDKTATQSQELAADATTATFELELGAGDYVFTVSVVNDFSEGEDTSATVRHIVKPSTDPPTPVPTDPPTDPPVVTDPPTEEKTEKPLARTVECDGYNTGNRDVLKGKNLTLTCKVPSGAEYDASEIKWSFTMEKGVKDLVPHEKLEADPAISISSDNTLKQTQMTIVNIGVSQQGYYACSLGKKSSCGYQVIVTGEEEVKGRGAARGTLLSGILLLTSLLLLALLN